MTHFMDGCDHTWVNSLILTRWMRPYYGSILSCTLLWMAATMPHMSYVWVISCLFTQILGSSYMCSCKTLHPSLSFGTHALWGICYTVIFHHSCYSSYHTLEDLSRDLWEVTKLKNTCIMIPWVCTSCSLKTPTVKNPWKVLFSHWR